MGFLPGWDSIEGTEAIAHWLHIAAIVVLALLVVSEAAALIYDSRNHTLVAAASVQRDKDAAVAEKRRTEEEAKRRAEDEARFAAAEKSHAEEAARLRSELEETTKRVNEENSLKNRIRRALASIDQNVLREVDAGARQIVVRMQPHDLQKLQDLAKEEGARRPIDHLRQQVRAGL